MTPWTVARQAPLSMDFSRQEYWDGLPFPSPGDLPNPGVEPGSLTLQADSLPQDPSPLRGTLGSSLRSPAEGEGHEGFPPPPDKDLESLGREDPM